MKLTVASLTEVPEALRGEYEERAGKFVLKLEGEYQPLIEATTKLTEANTKLAEFRDNNRALNSAKTTLEAQLKAFEGIDPEEHGKLKTRIAELEKKGVKGSEDITEMLRTAVAAAVGPLEKKIADREASEKAAIERADRESLRSALTAAGTKVGIDDRAMQDYIGRGLQVFSVVNGEVVARKGDMPVFSKTRVTEPLTVDEWAQELQTEAPHLFRPSKGGGAGGSGSGGHTGPKKVISSDPLEFGRNLEGLAKGEVTVSY